MDQDLLSVLELIEADLKLRPLTSTKKHPSTTAAKHFCKLFFFKPERSGWKIKCFVCVECGHSKHTQEVPPTVKTEWHPEMDLLVDYFPKLDAELAGLKKSVKNKINGHTGPRFKAKCKICEFQQDKRMVLE